MAAEECRAGAFCTVPPAAVSPEEDRQRLARLGAPDGGDGVPGDVRRLEQHQPVEPGGDPDEGVLPVGAPEFELAPPVRLPGAVHVQDGVAGPNPAGLRVMVAVEMDAQGTPRRHRMQPAAVAVPVAECLHHAEQFADPQAEQPSDQFRAGRGVAERVFRGQLAVLVAMPERPGGFGPFGLRGTDQFRLGPVIDDDVPKRFLAHRAVRVSIDNRGHTCNAPDQG
ncbi:MAG: hypothetical protein KatS3mg114_0503 [Planctomycetaceae bacterium]|nr:MAG: hypothetical protein KatS3mg114_0503 [Planctomycetaceae bacterium]